MKARRTLILFTLTLISFCAGGPARSVLAQTIDFDSVPPFAEEVPTYSEDGFTLSPNIGAVLIHNTFAPFSNAAHPTFGFGQGFDSGFTFTSDLHLLFSLLSVDLLEATELPEPFGVTLIGTRSDSSVVTRTFTLDGIAGAQTFALPPEFSDLNSLRIAEDTANGIFTEAVQVDNVRFAVVPEPSTWSLFGLSVGVILLRSCHKGRRKPAARALE